MRTRTGDENIAYLIWIEAVSRGRVVGDRLLEAALGGLDETGIGAGPGSGPRTS